MPAHHLDLNADAATHHIGIPPMMMPATTFMGRWSLVEWRLTSLPHAPQPTPIRIAISQLKKLRALPQKPMTAPRLRPIIQLNILREGFRSFMVHLKFDCDL